MPNRFIDSKDIDTFDKYNKELVGNLTTNQDGIINQIVVVLTHQILIVMLSIGL